MTEYRILDRHPDRTDEEQGDPVTDRAHALALLTICKEVASYAGLAPDDYVLQKREGGGPWVEVADLA